MTTAKVQVEENVLWHATEVVEGLTQPGAQGGDVFPRAGHELHVARAAVAQGGYQGEQRVAASANVSEVSLHLLAWRRLEPHQRLGLALLQRCQPGLELADAARVTALLDLAQQHGGRNPSRPGLPDAFMQVALAVVELACARLPRSVALRVLVSQVPAHRVA